MSEKKPASEGDLDGIWEKIQAKYPEANFLQSPK